MANFKSKVFLKLELINGFTSRVPMDLLRFSFNRLFELIHLIDANGFPTFFIDEVHCNYSKGSTDLHGFWY